jgi:hypothetical protein
VKITHLFLIAAVCLALIIPVAPAQEGSNTLTAKAADWSAPNIQQGGDTSGAEAAGWSTPSVIYQEAWDDPLFFSLDDNHTRLVALIPNSGSDDNSRHIVVSEYISGAWQSPVTIAQNGMYSNELVQFLPQKTHPIISGDGSTIAYVGHTGTTVGLYIVNRSGSNWSAPQLQSTELANTHYRISLSQDGNTLALCDYPFFSTQQVYVMTRMAGVWFGPTLIGVGGDPSLSADGKKLTYIKNARVVFTENILGTWTTPQELTDNTADEFSAEYPQMSGDGQAIYYWLVTLVPEGSSLIRSAQDLYILRREGIDWSAPQKVNTTSIIPAETTEGPASANYYATRLIYTRPITTTVPVPGSIDQSELEISEWITNTWQTTTLVDDNGFNNFNKWPRLSSNGKSLVFDGGTRYVDGVPVNNALWQMTTESKPSYSPWGCSVTSLIGPLGGNLLSDCDKISYVFGAGTVTDTVEVTHSFWPNPNPPPSGMAGIGGIGGIGGLGTVGGYAGLGGAFSTTMFGPGGLTVQPSKPVTVTVNYTDTNPGATITGTLGLYRWNSDVWNPVLSWDDPNNKMLTGTMTHFSDFAIFGETYQIFLPLVVR